MASRQSLPEGREASILDMATAEAVHEALSERVDVLMSPIMVAALDRVARAAGCAREAVIREYVAESLPDGWPHNQRRG